MPAVRARYAFTLIELLIVIAIVGLLAALLIPAVSHVTQSANRAKCVSNIRQIGMAILAYQATYDVLPPGTTMTAESDGTLRFQGWSVQARILPYLDANNKCDALNFDLPYDSPANKTVASVVVDVFVCPSDPLASAHRYGEGHHNINYAVNRGDWYVFGGLASNLPAPNAPFFVNSSVSSAQIHDGVSKTLFLAEVKARMPYIRDIPELTYEPSTSTQQPLPTDDPVSVPSYRQGGGSYKADTGHSEWHDGGSHQTGFTTAWPPNKMTGGSRGADKSKDVDIVGMRERTGGPTYAAVTARSHHSGGVNVLFGDGSVQFIGNGIDGLVWRALGTINGQEVVSGDQY